MTQTNAQAQTAAHACMVRVSGLHKSFGNNKVLRGVDLAVKPGEVVVIMGSSGSGKTTLIRSLNFLEVPDCGEVTVCNTRLVIDAGTSLTREQRRLIRDIRQKTAMVFQSFNLFTHMTVVKNIIEGPTQVKGADRSQALQQARALLRQVGLADKEHEYPNRLSGGQKQRVAIARALAMRPQVIFFDEPTSALDPELRDEVLNVMRKLADEGMTMIVVTHEVRFARDVADRVIFLEDGVVLADMAAENFFDAPANDRIRQFLGKVA